MQMINVDIIISQNESLIEALNKMNTTERKLLIVCDCNKFLGVISIGDVQRAILSKCDMNQPLFNFMRQEVTFVKKGYYDIERVKASMLEGKIEAMPVIDERGMLCDVIEWNQLFPYQKNPKSVLDKIPVVIMAGGKGTRLLPLTNVIPKPLIPVSDKTIIEEIMERFQEAGCTSFYLSVNYMMDRIEDYFKRKPEWEINYLKEKKPLGTGGSLYLLKDKVKSSFFVTNCDTLVDVDLFDLIDYHRKNKHLVTVVSAIKTMHIPYGTLETETDGIVIRVKEKPDYVYQLNTGFYVLEPEVLAYIEDEEFLNIPDLICRIISNGGKVGSFPVSENSWIDMGNWDEYLRLVDKYKR